MRKREGSISTSPVVVGALAYREQLSYHAAVKSGRRIPLQLFILAMMAARPASAGLSARLVYWRSGTAESCPEQAVLKKAVARRLGYDPFFIAAPYTIVAEMSGTGSELRARARLLDESGIVKGSRELTGNSADCAELLTSLALAISLTLDPMAAVNEPSEEPEPAAPEQPTPPPVVKAPEAAAEAVRPAQPAPEKATNVDTHNTSLQLEAGLLGTLGWVPAVAPAVTVGATVRHRHFALALSGVVVAPQTKALDSGPEAKVQLNYLALAPCAVMGTIKACAVGTFGNYAAEGGGVNEPRKANRLHAAAGVRAATSIALSERWALALQADAVVVLTRPDFLVAGQQVYRPSRFAVNLGISAAYQLF